MSPHRWRRVQDLFATLADLPAADRARVLEREASGDPRLRAEVEALLEAEPEAVRFFVALGEALPPAPSPRAPRRA